MSITVQLSDAGSSDWPAWVQAGGSIVAILIAAQLVKLERLNADVSNMEAFHGLCLAVKEITDLAGNSAEEHLLNGQALYGYPIRRLEDLPDFMQQTPVFSLGSTKAAQLLLDMKQLVWELEALVWPQQVGGPPIQINRIREINSKVSENCDTVQGWVLDRRRRAGWWFLPFSDAVLDRLSKRRRR